MEREVALHPDIVGVDSQAQKDIQEHRQDLPGWDDLGNLDVRVAATSHRGLAERQEEWVLRDVRLPQDLVHHAWEELPDDLLVALPDVAELAVYWAK